ncbi:xaa-Pro aminopeptidase 1-like isoform X1 [Acropora millepora]|uniref:xaa-Pro aminopeptidase 1-like isoform X1 n=2 Tax=Acropora millepora TaxID=45264 RepID=UPI001CF4C173|nr:xaa-Pro aminopeptidase 1-like isoform X1 [Acropora millepora]
MVVISSVILLLLVISGSCEIPDLFGPFQDTTQQRVCSKRKPQFLPRTSVNTSKRLLDLRKLMSKVKRGGIQAYIIPSVDAHQSEDVAPQHQRREYISGFSGSHGTAIVTKQKAALWTDGRYFLQANMELDCNWILQREGVRGTPSQSLWLIQNLSKGSKVGVDPFLFPLCEWDRMFEDLKKYGIELLAIQQNLIDDIWKESRPRPQMKNLIVLDVMYSGKTWQAKVLALRDEIRGKSATSVILQKLDEIAWLFNLRGFDIKYTPVFFSYAVVTNEDIMLFLDLEKVSTRIKDHLNVDLCPNKKVLCVLLKSYDSITAEIKTLAKEKQAKIWITTTASQGIRMSIPKDKLFVDESPVSLPKALKNQAEIEGMKKANLKDSVAMSEFFSWVEKETSRNSSRLTELKVEAKLLHFRRQQENFISPSFATISGFGPNSAIIHYKATKFTDATINKNGIFLLDSGGQYLDGTTDTTRTVHFGVPTEHQKDCYTRVLKGHIDIANAVFPNDTFGRTLDVFAREPLWKIGLDYRHGTGHGIGHFLNVHEGPQCIAPGFPGEDEKILMPGMILSDEPGYYEDGSFGIRLETAVLVKPANTKYHFDGLEYLKFEPVIYMPFQSKLINVSMLSKSQVDWLNEYHRKTREVTGKALKEQGKMEALDWLLRETRPLQYELR